MKKTIISLSMIFVFLVSTFVFAQNKSETINLNGKVLWEGTFTPVEKFRIRLEVGANKTFNDYKLKAILKLRMEQWLDGSPVIAKVLESRLISSSLPYVDVTLGRWSYKYSDAFFFGQYIFGYGQTPMYPVREVNGFGISSRIDSPFSFALINLVQNDALNAGLIGNIAFTEKEIGLKIGLNSLSSFITSDNIILSKIPAGEYTAYSLVGAIHPKFESILKGSGVSFEIGNIDTESNFKYTIGIDFPKLNFLSLCKFEIEKQEKNKNFGYALSIAPKPISGINFMAQILSVHDKSISEISFNDDVTSVLRVYKTF